MGLQNFQKPIYGQNLRKLSEIGCVRLVFPVCVYISVFLIAEVAEFDEFSDI